MAAFLASLGLFIALHSVPAIPSIRARLIGSIGRGPYFLVYSVVSLGLLALVFRTAFQLDPVPLWDPAPWQAWVTILCASAGLLLIFAGLISPNPLSITLRRENGSIGAVTRITRHPVQIGFLLWACGHVFPNGDLASVVLFSIFALFSVGGIAMQERRAKKRLGHDFDRLCAFAPILPFTGPAAPRVDRGLLFGIILAAATTLILLFGLHALLFGVDPLGLALAF